MTRENRHRIHDSSFCTPMCDENICEITKTVLGKKSFPYKCQRKCKIKPNKSLCILICKHFFHSTCRFRTIMIAKNTKIVAELTWCTGFFLGFDAPPESTSMSTSNDFSFSISANAVTNLKNVFFVGILNDIL